MLFIWASAVLLIAQCSAYVNMNSDGATSLDGLQVKKITAASCALGHADLEYNLGLLSFSLDGMTTESDISSVLEYRPQKGILDWTSVDLLSHIAAGVYNVTLPAQNELYLYRTCHVLNGQKFCCGEGSAVQVANGYYTFECTDKTSKCMAFSSMTVSLGGESSIESWYYPVTGSPAHAIFDAAKVGVGEKYYLYLTSSRTFILYMTPNIINRAFSDTGELKYDQWNHIMLTVSSSSYVTLYFNGIIVQEFSMSAWSVDTELRLAFGTDVPQSVSDPTVPTFPGYNKMASYRVWKKVKNGVEVSELSSSFPPISDPTTDMEFIIDGVELPGVTYINSEIAWNVL